MSDFVIAGLKGLVATFEKAAAKAVAPLKDDATAAAIVAAEVAAVGVARARAALKDFARDEAPYVALCREFYGMLASQAGQQAVDARRREVATRVEQGLVRAIADESARKRAVAAARKRISRAAICAAERHSGLAVIDGKPTPVNGLAVTSADAITSTETEADRRGRARARDRAQGAKAELDSALASAKMAAAEYAAARGTAKAVAMADAMAAAIGRLDKALR